MTMRVTILQAGRTDIYGLPFLVGTTYTVATEYGIDLVQQGYASDTDSVLGYDPNDPFLQGPVFNTPHSTANPSGVITVAGVAPGTLGDVAAASISSALQTPQNMSWTAHIAAGNGTYDGQRRRITSGVGNRPFILEWIAADSVWDPVGCDQIYYIGAVQTDSTAVTQSITLPTVAHPANFWRSGLGMAVEIMTEDSASATARSLKLTLGSTDFVDLPTATNRRVGGLFGWVADGATSQWSYTKKDSASFSPYESGNSNLTTMAETLANALNFSGTVTVTAAGTLTLRRLRLHLVRG